MRKSERPVIRPATKADLDAYYALHPQQAPRPTVTAWVGYLGDEPIAVGGFAHVGGKLIAFFDEDPKARPFKITLVKAARKMVQTMAAKGRVMYAQIDPKEPGATRWVKSLGFKETGIADIYQWRDS